MINIVYIPHLTFIFGLGCRTESVEPDKKKTTIRQARRQRIVHIKVTHIHIYIFIYLYNLL